MNCSKLERNDVMIRYMHVDFHFEEAQIEKKFGHEMSTQFDTSKNETILSFFFNLCQL